MSVHLKIVLAKPNHTYSTGETVFGAVHIINETAAELKLLHGLYVVFFGGAMTDLKGARVRSGVRVVSTPSLLHQSRNKFADHQMRGKEFYLNRKVHLTTPAGAANADGRTIMPGDNVFPFQLVLPQNLISSFRGAHGIVEYDISTSIRLLTGSLTKMHSAKQEFKVVANTVIYPPAWEAETVEFHKQLSQWRCLNVSVICPVRESLPGECLHTNVRVNSITGHILRKIRVEFVQEITYKCPVGSFTDYHVLTNSASNDWDEFVSAPLSVRLPSALPPSTITDCDIGALISINYFLSVKLKVDSQLELVKVGKIPITVGTVRNRGFESRRQSHVAAEMRLEPEFNAQAHHQRSRSQSEAELPEAPPYALFGRLGSQDSVEEGENHENRYEFGFKDEISDEFRDCESPPPTYAEALLQMELESGAR